MPDKSAGRVERPEDGPKGERSESSMYIIRLDAGEGWQVELISASLTFVSWHLRAFAGNITEFENEYQFSKPGKPRNHCYAMDRHCPGRR
jgi:hypothetical protein